MKTILSIIALATASYSSIIDVDAVSKINEVQSDIQFLKSDEGLSIQSRASLDSLQIKATELANVLYNKRCETISINSMPDPRCKILTQKVNAFMETYATATKRIYISQLKSLSKYQDKTEKMQACVEALPTFINTQTTPDKIFPLEATFNSEEIEDNQITLQFNITTKNSDYIGRVATQKSNDVVNRRNAWRKECREVVTYRLNSSNPATNRNVPTSAFIKAVNEYYSNTNFIFERDIGDAFFVIGSKNAIKYAILVKNSKGIVAHKFIVEYIFGVCWAHKYINNMDKRSPERWFESDMGPDDNLNLHYRTPNIRLTQIGVENNQNVFKRHFGSITLPSDSYTIEIVPTTEFVKVEEY